MTIDLFTTNKFSNFVIKTNYFERFCTEADLERHWRIEATALSGFGLAVLGWPFFSKMNRPIAQKILAHPILYISIRGDAYIGD